MRFLSLRPARPALVAASLTLLCALATPAAAQTATETLYLYQGADREQRLLERARQEGVVTLFTSMQLPDSGPLTQAFETKYGIKVLLWRSTGADHSRPPPLRAHAAEPVCAGLQHQAGAAARGAGQL